MKRKIKKSFKEVDEKLAKSRKPDAKFALNETQRGMKVSFCRVIGDDKTLKGIVDRIVINDDIEISREHNRYVIRRVGNFNCPLMIEPHVSNVVNIPDGHLEKELIDVLSKRD